MYSNVFGLLALTIILGLFVAIVKLVSSKIKKDVNDD